jgi:large subunit ribosomal protein L17
MRHRKTVVKLGRTAAHRKATLTNLAIALISKKHIKTTVAKAKATRQVVEKLITLAKEDTQHSRRLAFKRLNQKQVVQTLFDEIAPMFKDRPGGYTRVIKLGQRQGDGAQMAVIELVGFETAMKKKKEKDKAKDTESKKKNKKKEKQAEEQTA